MLHTLILSQNKIKDEGLIELSNTLLKRVQDYTDVSDAMILHLAIADTRITDAGFKFCIKKLDSIFQIKQRSSLDDQAPAIHFDFSSNNLTEVSIKAFAESLKKYHSYREVKMSALQLDSARDQMWFDIAAALQQN